MATLVKQVKFDGLVQRYENLSDSDKRAVIILGAFLIVCLLYFVTRLSFDYRNRNIAALAHDRELMLLLNTNEHRIKVAKNSSKNFEGVDKPLLTLVSSTAKDNHIAFKRFQPDGENVVKLWMEHVEFNYLLFWLHHIERKNGISVQDISVEQAKDDGFVDVRLTLQR
jgi:type II secretory pathway component PulM